MISDLQFILNVEKQAQRNHKSKIINLKAVFYNKDSFILKRVAEL